MKRLLTNAKYKALNIEGIPFAPKLNYIQMKHKIILFLSLWIGVCINLFAQKKQVTLEDTWLKGTFQQKTVQAVNWMKDGSFYTSLKDGKIVKHQVSDGAVLATIYDPTSDKITIDDYTLSANEKKILISTNYEGIYRRSGKAECYVYDISAQQLSKLSSNGKQMFATLSPDGTKVAFVRDNNVFVTDLANMSEQAVTTDGKKNEIINGWGDWVYEEELSLAKAFEWSPDSKKIAYYRFDESRVSEYNMQMWGKLYPEDYRFKYPKAGEANATVQIFVHDLATQQSIKMDTGIETDNYIARINWTNTSNFLSIRRLNRLQNTLEILHANTQTGNSNIIYTDKTDTYIDIDAVDDLYYLKNGQQFITSSERSGYKHLYLYDMNGTLLRQLTAGNWQVTDLYGVDETAKTLYFSSTEVSPLERHLYSLQYESVVANKSKKAKPYELIKRQLSSRAGTNRANFSTDFKYFILYNTSSNTPNYVTLHTTPLGQEVKVLEDNKALVEKLETYEITKKSFFQFKTPEGIELNGWMIKPQNFEATKQYPVLMFVYGGPGSQTVTNAWDNRDFYWYQVLAQKGYIIVSVDNRGTGARGVDFQKCTYKNLGKLEVIDQIATAQYLQSLSFIDKNRVGIWGWSYGGFMSSNCITQGADVFKTAIAVAPVTNWRYYDSIYTERYQQTPQVNAAGYDDNSPVNHAKKLKGNYLLIHGTGDDNVHFQNAVMMEEALIKANKQFRSFYYPNKSHSISGGGTRLHLYQMMTDFIIEKL
jgi:dipeptidyl-peptidase 4